MTERGRGGRIAKSRPEGRRVPSQAEERMREGGAESWGRSSGEAERWFGQLRVAISDRDCDSSAGPASLDRARRGVGLPYSHICNEQSCGRASL